MLDATAQASYSDFELEHEPVKRAIYALDLYNRYIREDLDSIKIVGINLLVMEVVPPYARAAANRLLGSYQVRQGEFEDGILKLKQAAGHFEKMEDYTLTSEIYNDIGHGFFLDGEYDEAIESYQRSINMGELGIDETAIFNGELGLGKAYMALGDTTLGLYFITHYKDKSLEHKKYEAVADAYGYLAMIAEQQYNMDLSHEYYIKSYKYSLKSNSKIHLSHALNNRAIVFFDADEVDSAIVYFYKALAIRESLSNPKPVVDSYYNLASLYQLIDSTSKAQKYFTYAMDISQEHGFIADEMDAIDALLHYKYGNTTNENDLQQRKAELTKLLENRQGLDQKVIDFVYENLEEYRAPVKKEPTADYEFLWIACIVLMGLGVLYYTRNST